MVQDPKLSAYDKATGKVVGEVALPRNATAAPMTYLLNGKQFIVVADRRRQPAGRAHRVEPALERRQPNLDESDRVGKGKWVWPSSCSE